MLPQRMDGNLGIDLFLYSNTRGFSGKRFSSVSCRESQPAIWGIGRGGRGVPQERLIVKSKSSHPRPWAASIRSQGINPRSPGKETVSLPGLKDSPEMNWMLLIRYPTHCWVLLPQTLTDLLTQLTPTTFLVSIAQRKDVSVLAINNRALSYVFLRNL